MERVIRGVAWAMGAVLFAAGLWGTWRLFGAGQAVGRFHASWWALAVPLVGLAALTLMELGPVHTKTRSRSPDAGCTARREVQ